MPCRNGKREGRSEQRWILQRMVTSPELASPDFGSHRRQSSPSQLTYCSYLLSLERKESDQATTSTSPSQYFDLRDASNHSPRGPKPSS